MRSTSIEICGVTYPLCFTLGVMFSFCDRYGDMDQMWPRLRDLREAKKSTELFREYLWQLERLMNGGYQEAVQSDGKAEEPISAAEMENMLCLGDVARVQEAISQAIVLGSSREVGTQAPKAGGEAGEQGQTG